MMSTVGDENAGPGVPLKETGGQDSVSVSALKQSNKANIMSPPLSPQKKLNRADGPSSQDSTLRKEHLDQTVTIDSSLADDDDIISFKPPENFAEVADEEDPFKPRKQLSNSPINNKPQAVSLDHASPVGPTLETAQSGQHEQESECGSGDKPSQPGAGVDDDASNLADRCAKPVTDASEKNETSDIVREKDAGELTSESSDTIPPKPQAHEELDIEIDPFKPSRRLTQSPAKDDFDPFKPKSQVLNSPAVASADLDPFKPSKQLANSPDKAVAAIDPFKPKIQLKNSPERPIDTTDNDGPGSANQLPGSSTLKSSDSTVDHLHQPQPSANIVQQTEATHKTSSIEVIHKSSDSTIVEPFKPKTQLVNTPVGKSLAVNSFMISQSDADSVQLQTATSETLSSLGENTEVLKGDSQSSVCSQKEDTSTDLDPFKPRTQLVNSPLTADDDNENIDPFKSEAQLVNSPLKTNDEKEVDPFKPILQLANSPTKTEGITSMFDPLKTNAQLSNSPAKAEGNDVEMDPFQPKAQLVNSPAKVEDTKSEVDPFKPKTQMANSPGKTDVSVIDPFKPKAQLANSAKADDLTSEVDPFKPKAQLANSPDKTKVDPFKPKAQLANSPAKADDLTSEVDLFKPKAQLANSPDKTEVDPFKPKAHLANSPDKTEVDPFKPKAQLTNSPAKADDLTSEVDPFKPKAQLANSPGKEEVDPFKPKAQLADSLGNTEVDPFKPKAQLATSPVNTKLDPFKPKAQLVNLPDKTIDIDTEVDPFKSKAQLANSPAKIEDISSEIDLVKPQTQLVNSPAKTEDISSEIDPFKSKTQLANSPDKTDISSDVDSLKPQTQPAVCASSLPEAEGQKKDTVGKKGESTTACLEGLDALEGVGTREMANNPVLLASGIDLGFDEDMFISGTQAFNDPSALDLLEQFGGAGEAKETDLRKCSLYVKFDPLVKPSLPKTPEKMPAPTQPAPRRAVPRQNDLLNCSQLNASQMNASVGEESVCLFGTPPKVSRRRSILNQRRMNLSSVSQTITEEEHAKPVDLLFSLEANSAEGTFLNDTSKKADITSGTLVDVEEGAKYTEAQFQELKQKVVLQYEGQMLARERQFVAQLQDKSTARDRLQEQVDTLTAELQKQNREKASMAHCVAEYEKTLDLLIAAKEKISADAKSDIDDMKKERDQALEDVLSLENAFSDLHRRYEKMKQTVQGYMKNEETLQETVKTWEEKAKVLEDTLAKVKAKAEDKIEEVVNSMEKKKEAESARFDVELKRTRLEVQSLKNSLEQKTKENKELAEMCDTLIAQVEGSGK